MVPAAGCAALIFRGHAMPELASLAWTVALLHLAGHALAKGSLFLAADGVYRATDGYGISHTDLLRRSSWLFGLGALFIAVVLAFPNGLAGIWRDHVQPRIDRLISSRKSRSGNGWTDNSVADGAPAE